MVTSEFRSASLLVRGRSRLADVIGFFLMLTNKQKEKLIFLVEENKYKKYKNFLNDVIKTWENKTPTRLKYGLFYKAGKFATKAKCCLISAALDGKQILEEDYYKSDKTSSLYDFCVERHFSLSKYEVQGITFGFDKNAIKYKTENKEAYLFGLKISEIIFNNT